MKQDIAATAFLLSALGITFAGEAHVAGPKKQGSEIYQGWPFDAAEARRRQKETAQQLETTPETSLDLEKGMKLGLVLIPAGRFTMGSRETEKSRHEDEVQHEVTLTKPYWIGKCEVTQQQYEQVMGKNPSILKGARNPVENVSWNDAQEFCRKLSQQTRRDVRLATEAEWEYACRAGSPTKYSFGDEENELYRFENYCDRTQSSGFREPTREHNDGHEKTAPAGSFPPNAFGLYDMHGNVCEWCEDWYGEYGNGAKRDPTGAVEGKDRVLRGGSWRHHMVTCRSAYRFKYPPYRQFDSAGFRVVVSLP